MHSACQVKRTVSLTPMSSLQHDWIFNVQ